MRSDLVSRATRFGEMTTAVLVAVFLLPAFGAPASVPLPAADWEVDSFPLPAQGDLARGDLAQRDPMTTLDSVQAERALPAAAVRRPLEAYLGRFSDDRLLVRRISRAVVREADRQQVPPSLIAAVLLTENTTLRPEAASSVGAQGLMQVMPFHAGARLCNSDDLVDVDSNICHGTLILARNLRATHSSAAALLRYNGCVRGTNTPDCWRYPNLVLARAGRVRHEILASAGAQPVQIAQR
jgi:soluble lytic murein transglycosylase-like protein